MVIETFFNIRVCKYMFSIFNLPKLYHVYHIDLVNDNFMNIVKNNKEYLDSIIGYSRDFSIFF